MTTHAWAETAKGTWKLEIFFDDDEKQTTGEFFEWILLLHGTKEQPYAGQTPLNERTKLAVAKNIHLNDFKEKEKFVEVLKQDHQKRVGDENDMNMFYAEQKAESDDSQELDMWWMKEWRTKKNSLK